MILWGLTAAAAPAVVSPTAGGAVVLAATPQGGQTALHTLHLDPAGQPIGTAALLRETSGEVVALAADGDDRSTWVGWVSMLQAPTADEPGRFFAAVQQLAPEPAAPITLGFYTMHSHPEHGAIAVAVRPNGGVWVAASDTSRPCRFQALPEEPGCLGYSVYSIDPGTSEARRLHTGALSGGPHLSIDSLTHTPAGPVSVAWTWRGGANVDVQAPQGSPPTCRPPLTHRWHDGALHTLCPQTFGPEDCPAADDGLCFLAGTDTLAPVDGWRLDCPEGGPEVTLIQGGQALTLPIRSATEGAPFGLGVWAGAAFVTLHDGTPQATPCTPRQHPDGF